MKQLPVIQPVPASAPSTADPQPSGGLATAVRYRVEGMDCGSCARTLERVVGGLDGVEAAEVSFGAGTLSLWGDVPDDRVFAAVSSAGFRARPFAARREAPTAFWRRDRRAVSTVASMVLLAAAVLIDVAGAGRVVAEPAYLASMVVGGWPIARAAVAALRRRALDMNVLMMLAAVGAVAIGAYAEGAWVLVLFALGTTLETYALDRTRRSVEALAELAPVEARLREAGDERMVLVEAVPVGSVIVVRPGERVPLDGVVLGGDSSVDQSAVTGESVPIEKTAGDHVYAGTLNQFGVIDVRTTHDAASSTISRIVELVEQAQASRAPSERMVDRFARVYTPAVFASALLVAIVPVLVGGDLSTWLYRALALLIVACPCSLVISIPVAVVSAIGAAARDGILVKGGEALENLARIRVVCLDKTGTVTYGAPTLTTTATATTLGDNEALRLVATVERHSEHPLGQALVRAAADRGITVAEPQRFLALPGRGVDALVAGRALWAGGPRLARERLDADGMDAIAALEAGGETVIALGEQDRLLALFGLADTVRTEAASVVSDLRHWGVERVVMLTGDDDSVAQAVAAEVGIADWHASLLPEDKLRLVEELGSEAAVAMVGDGVNDAPALAGARVGIAMGAAGSGIALETADVALMADDLSGLSSAIGLARRAVAVMRQNIVASLVVKGGVLMLVPFGLVTLWMAVAADMGMSLLVTANGLRLLARRG